MDKEEILKKARELGKGIRESPEFKELLEAQQALDGDSEVQELLKEYEDKRKSLEMKQMAGESIEQEAKELGEIEQKVMSLESMKKYSEAENKFKELIDDANKEIVKAMEEKE